MTWVTNSERSISAEISPVKAPLFSALMFWAPSLRLMPPMALPTLSSAVNGGHSTMSTEPSRPISAAMSLVRAAPSAAVLFIFQLPAISLRRIMGVGVGMGYPRQRAGRKARPAILGFEERHTWEHL